MNSDATYPQLKVQKFVEILELWKPGAAQPANNGHDFWNITRLHRPSFARITDFVEVGPLLAIRVNLWIILRSMMHPEVSSGWGVDRILCSIIADNANYTQIEGYREETNVWLSIPEKYSKSSTVIREQWRLCPRNLSFWPACMVIDETTITHLDYHEGHNKGVYDWEVSNKEKWWYWSHYKKYIQEVGSIGCTISP